MTSFELDSRLARDCFILGKINSSLLLIMNNALLPWFIIVPQTSATEIIDLPETEQKTLQEEINLVASFVKSFFPVTKLNIATIGNIVSQLHIHVVGRNPSDYCWPNVVWGTTEKKSYTEQHVEEITVALKKKLGSNFT